jgi:hypothetical protein
MRRRASLIRTSYMTGTPGTLIAPHHEASHIIEARVVIKGTVRLDLGCPRKCVFDFRRITEFFEKYTEFRGISRNFAVFFAVKFAGIPYVFA